MTSEQIAEVIASKEHCRVTSFRHHQIIERFKGKTVWEGLITQFTLSGHAAPSCFAWIDPDSKELVTVLERPPVTSPEIALRAYLVSKK